MKRNIKMLPEERRAAVSLAGIFALRMLGMFIILPVFALYALHLPGGEDKTMVGLALGTYGLTQALFQIPLGWLSDRVGRKPVIIGGLLVFAAGSFMAAQATDITGIILGRAVQGSGAISSALIALTGDLTREQVRTRAMAMIGVTIGITFSLSMALSPLLYPLIGVPGLFLATGILSLMAIGVLRWGVPTSDQPVIPAARMVFARVLLSPELLRLNWGIFALHASLMATFVVVPSALIQDGMAQSQQWKLYLPVMLGSFLLMIPPVAFAHGKWRKQVFLGCVLGLVAAQLLLSLGLGSVDGIALALSVFFVAFNVLEASLPSLVTLLAPLDAKGTATGVYSTIQFLGTFTGASAGGVLFKYFGATAVPLFCAGLAVLWLILALPMQVSPKNT